MTEYLKIPEERIGLLLAENEKVKKEIEKATKTKLEIDTELHEITILPAGDDQLGVWQAKDVVTAIGRGFLPETAFRLLEENCELRVVNLKEYVGKSKKGAERIKGRVIGKEGKAKKRIEDFTNSDICVYGKTVAIIGPMASVDVAAQAVELLAGGSMHNTVFKFLENAMKSKAQHI